MIKPEKIISCSIQENSLMAVCKKGSIYLTPYADNIIHFRYNPSGNNEETTKAGKNCGYKSSVMWGIEAQPDSNIHYDFSKNNSQISYSISCIRAVFNENKSISFINKSDKEMLALIDYFMEPAVVLGENTYHIHAEFSASEDEKFFGLGQHQDGKLNLGGREQIMWHDYSHKDGEIVAVPFMVTNKGYGILFDNPSRMRVTPGVEGRTSWQAEVGEEISFFLITGEQADDIYKGFRLLTGITPLPPRKGLGFIQCKQRYASQKELLEVASSYRERGYPCDIFVVDWFHWKILGDLSLDTEFWPDSVKMNKQLEDMGYETMISCWPRFMKESDYYNYIEEKGWFMKDAQGNTVYGTPDDERGALIDTTSPECGKWYFETIKRNYGDLGYKYYWTDEDEPDISPHESFLYAGTGARVHNIYPLTHTKCIYEGHRKSFSHRCLTLSRAAYPGAQKYGTTFWSSDIFPEWDVLKRQIPTALNFCASGMPYWSSDIGGWQALPDENMEEDYSSLLLQTSSEGNGIVTRKNYAELYIRWFQFGVFCPTFRTHGTRKENEIWSYGEEAEKILAKYLRLRYRLMPYIYSLAYQVNQTGAPMMRALWMDFSDKICADIEDEFMFGSSILVAPVTEQGASSRQVYFPKDCDWYDFWSGKKLKGGQTVTAQAPVDTLPLFVKEGSILPVGEVLLNSGREQKYIEIHVYPGKNVSFPLYSDDGKTYCYEKGDYSLVNLIWDEKEQILSKEEVHTCEGLIEKKYTVNIHDGIEKEEKWKI
ncbi:MAG: DUF5110 domain-containing protein [Lachnospiraceae bacterium]|nr:DUF5110 domain-containing protein [Lachnospiraceae bacterium]